MEILKFYNNHLFQTLIESIDKFKKSIEDMKEQHNDRKRVWTEKSDELTDEWKRLAKMTPQEYYAEFKAKQVQFFFLIRNKIVNA